MYKGYDTYINQYAIYVDKYLLIFFIVFNKTIILPCYCPFLALIYCETAQLGILGARPPTHPKCQAGLEGLEWTLCPGTLAIHPKKGQWQGIIIVLINIIKVYLPIFMHKNAISINIRVCIPFLFVRPWYKYRCIYIYIYIYFDIISY